MGKIRILVIDDSIIVRKTLGSLLGKEPDFEVVGTARNGVEGLKMFGELKPDIIILDIVMPVMDGLEALSNIRKSDKVTPVIMFSSLTENGAAITLDALARGANDYVAKPSRSMSPLTDTTGSIKGQLVPKIRVLAAASRARLPGAKSSEKAQWEFKPPIVPDLNIPERRNARPEVVAIGVSTGGPEALHKVLTAIPGSFPVPILVVQHMPALFTRALSERLDRFCALKVREAVDGELLEPGTIYFGPGDFHMSVKKDGLDVRILVTREPPINSCRPSVDALFHSLAPVFGRRTMALVLTGMGKDGLSGCVALRKTGATILAQDRESSVIWGMPGHVAEANLANKVVPLERMAFEIVRAVVGAS
ncbi:MAG: chemotaxis response regulator protein-glutamate methylesterase [Pseudomonadota bacterium]